MGMEMDAFPRDGDGKKDSYVSLSNIYIYIHTHTHIYRVVNIELLFIADNYRRYFFSIASFIGDTLIANYRF